MAARATSTTSPRGQGTGRRAQGCHPVGPEGLDQPVLDGGQLGCDDVDLHIGSLGGGIGRRQERDRCLVLPGVGKQGGEVAERRPHLCPVPRPPPRRQQGAVALERPPRSPRRAPHAHEPHRGHALDEGGPHRAGQRDRLAVQVGGGLGIGSRSHLGRRVEGERPVGRTAEPIGGGHRTPEQVSGPVVLAAVPRRQGRRAEVLGAGVGSQPRRRFPLVGGVRGVAAEQDRRRQRPSGPYRSGWRRRRGDRRLGQPHGVVEAALQPRRAGGGAEYVGPTRVIGERRVAGQLDRPARHVGQVAIGRHVVEPDRQRHPGVEVVEVAGQVPGGPEVGQLASEAGVGLGLVGARGQAVDVGDQLRRPRHQRLVRHGPAASDFEPAKGEGPHRLERAIARRVAERRRRAARHQHRGVDEVGDDRGGVARDADPGTEPLGGGEVDPARERGDGAEQRHLVVGQRPVGPLDRVAQGAVAGVGRRAPRFEQVERPVEAGVEVDQRQRPDPARRQLEGKREAVETPDDVGDERGVAAGGGQVGLRRRAWARNASTAGTPPAPSVPSSGTGSGPRRTRCSLARPSGSREVASRARSGQASTSAPARSRTGASTCSQLSSTTTGAPPARASRAAATTSSPSRGRSPSAVATAGTTWRSSVTAASSTSVTGRPPSAMSAAASSTRRVLPTPPGPTSVISRSVAMRRCSSASSCSRPTSGEAGRGRRPGPAPPAGARTRSGLAASGPSAAACSASASSGPGSRPVSSASRRRKSCAARSASACRPATVRTRTSRACVRSRSGSSAAARVASATRRASRSPAAAAARRAASHCVGQVPPQLGEGGRLGRQRSDVGELGQGGAAPQGRGPRQVAAGSPRAAPLGGTPGLGRVELVGLEGQAVPGAGPGEPLGGGPEVPAQGATRGCAGSGGPSRAPRRARRRRAARRWTRRDPRPRPAGRAQPGAGAPGRRRAGRRRSAAAAPAGRSAPARHAPARPPARPTRRVGVRPPPHVWGGALQCHRRATPMQAGARTIFASAPRRTTPRKDGP